MYPSRRPAPDPLDLHRLPPVGGCELNERLDPTDPRAARLEAVRTAAVLALSAAVLGVVPRLAADVAGPVLWRAPLWMAGACVALAGLAFLTGSQRVRHWAMLAAVWAALSGIGQAQAAAADEAAGWRLLFPAGVAAAAGLGLLVAKQYAYYAAANMLNDWDTVTRWRGYWQTLESGHRAPARPEVAATQRAVLALPLACGAGVAASRLGGSGAAGYLLGLAVAAPLVWPGTASADRCVRAALSAGCVFLTYDRAGCPAPGVFRFPTRWLRPWANRLLAAWAVLVLLAAALGAGLPPRRPAPPEAAVPASADHPGMAAVEWEHLGTLTDPVEREDYLRLVRARRRQEAEDFRRRDAAYDRALAATAAWCVAGPPVVTFATLVFLAGPLLAAYHRALELRTEPV